MARGAATICSLSRWPFHSVSSIGEVACLFPQYTRRFTQKIESDDFHPFDLHLGAISLPEEFRERLADLVNEYPSHVVRQDGNELLQVLRGHAQTGFHIRKHAQGEDTGRLLSKEEKKVLDMVSQQNNSSTRELGGTYLNVTGSLFDVEYGERTSVAYAATRLSATFGAACRVLAEIAARRPGSYPQPSNGVGLTVYIDFEPKRVLDFGCGPATATMAANTLWTSIDDGQIMAVDRSLNMLQIARHLLGDRTVDWLHSLPKTGIQNKYDLALASYSLNELPHEDAQREAAMRLFESVRPGGFLMIAEYGTPIGFNIVKTVRQTLLDECEDAAVFAPCVHSLSCPMPSTSWCHFAQRVQRSVRINPAAQSTEEEKFSYVIIERKSSSSQQSGENEWGRITRPTRKRRNHVIVDMCLKSPGGEEASVLGQAVITKKKHGKDIYGSAKKSKWGDLFPLGG